MSLIRWRSSLQLSRMLTRGGGGHYKGFNEPQGHFLGIPPAPAGYRRKKLWFESIYIYGFGGTWAAFFICWYYRPKEEMESWAYHEALRRMKERGEDWTSPEKEY